MNKQSALRRLRYILMLLALLALVTACAPDDLDITPTATATLTPTPTPTATPTPEGATAPEEEELELSEMETLLDAIIAGMPNQLAAGAVVWRRDFTKGTDGIEIPRNVQNGIAKRIFYNEQVGGQSNITFGVFESTEDAFAHYEFIRGIRSVLQTGREDDTFPLPNLFGSGLYGSVAIFQIDNVFIEVNIELFSSTQGNPLPSLSRGTINIFTGIMAEMEG